MLNDQSFYCFGFDGIVSSEAVLPMLAKEVGITDEMETLIDITIKGLMPFSKTFKLICKLLSTMPCARLQETMDKISIVPSIAEFIQEHRDRCVIITGHLDVYMQPIVEKLPCRFFTSKSRIESAQLLGLETLLDKGDILRMLRDREGHRHLVAIGNGVNDVPMFEAADLSICYFGVTRANEILYPFSNYVVFKDSSLCNLLKTL